MHACWCKNAFVCISRSSDHQIDLPIFAFTAVQQPYYQPCCRSSDTRQRTQIQTPIQTNKEMQPHCIAFAGTHRTHRRVMCAQKYHKRGNARTNFASENPIELHREQSDVLLWHLLQAPLYSPTLSNFASSRFVFISEFFHCFTITIMLYTSMLHVGIYMCRVVVVCNMCIMQITLTNLTKGVLCCVLCVGNAF